MSSENRAKEEAGKIGHTPGPWKVRSAPKRAKCVAFDISGERNGVCSLFDPAKSGNVVSKETVANANLIAASPDLYEACKAVLQSIHDEGEGHPLNQCRFIDKLRAAISKAEGKV